MQSLIKYFRSNLLHAGGLLSMLLIVSACNKNDNDNIPDVPAAGLMAFNLAPDLQAVNFTLSGNLLNNQPISFPNYTGGYQSIYTGERPVEAYNGSSLLASSTYNFEENKYYSLFVVGANNVYKNIVAADKFDSLSSSNGQAYIRYINAIPDSSKPLVTIAANGSNLISQNSAFSEVSDFVAVNPGDVAITASNDGNIQVNRTIQVTDKKVYTVLLTGIPGSTDSDKSVQIKFIENGTLSGTAGQNNP